MATASGQVKGNHAGNAYMCSTYRRIAYVPMHCFVLPACMYVWIHIGDTIIRAPRPVVTYTGYRHATLEAHTNVSLLCPPPRTQRTITHTDKKSA